MIDLEHLARQFYPQTTKLWWAKVPLPPSINHMYFCMHNHLVMNRRGKAYANEAWTTIATYPLRTKFEKEDPIDVTLLLVRKDIITKSWPKSKTKFKRFDLKNYDKLLIDTVFSYHQIDDSQVMGFHLHKMKGNDNFIVIFLAALPEDSYPCEFGYQLP